MAEELQEAFREELRQGVAVEQLPMEACVDNLPRQFLEKLLAHGLTTVAKVGTMGDMR